MRAHLCFACLALVVVPLAGCPSPLYAPCDSQLDCAADLRCVKIGGDFGAICTRPCTISKKRAGQPDVLDENALFEPGSTVEEKVEETACAEGDVEVSTQDGTGGKDVAVVGDIVGVCRISPEQVANGGISGDSQLMGFCTPL